MATNNMAVTLSQYNAARALFQQHYFLANCDTDFGGQEINIPWSDLNTAAETYRDDNKLTDDDVALRFVLCYNPTGNALYLRMQLCTLVLVTPTHYDLDTTNSVWYEISGDQMSTTQTTDLSDSDYLDYFYYCDANNCSPSSLENLASDTSAEKFVRNIVFPWGMEVKQMYTENQNVESIGFGACSFTGQNVNVDYPHTLVLYLMDDEKNKLMDDETNSNIFEMKGCDLGTVCPLCCNCYNLPQQPSA